MDRLNKTELQVLENFLKSDQEQTKNTMYTLLKEYYPNVVYNKKYIYAEGSTPIVLCAHMDTVFPKPCTEIYYDTKKNVMWSPQGAGFDDKAGIYAITSIIADGYRPHIVLTTDEEVGCLGASALASIPCPFKKVQFIIQLDRRGANDCIFYDCENEEFMDYIESFGFVTNFGSFTDIVELCPAWKCAGVNLSIGYRDEHTRQETLFVSCMLDTINKVKKILDQKVEDIPYFEYIESPDIPSYFNWDIQPQPQARCNFCGKLYRTDELLDNVKLIKGGVGRTCFDCFADCVELCGECGAPYQKKKSNDTGLCPSCNRKVKQNGSKRKYSKK